MFSILLLSHCTIVQPIRTSGNDDHLGREIVKESRTYLGTKYRYGGVSKKTGMDCSGLVFNVFSTFNIPINRTSRDQYKQGKKVSISEARPGDLVFFSSQSKVFHVAIVTKSSRNSVSMIHSTTSAGVIEENLFESRYWSNRIAGVKRIVQ